jgi:hypothetical protein
MTQCVMRIAVRQTRCSSMQHDSLCDVQLRDVMQPWIRFPFSLIAKGSFKESVQGTPLADAPLSTTFWQKLKSMLLVAHAVYNSMLFEVNEFSQGLLIVLC